jgi:YhcH/YjgK/YiaL family protein
VQGEEIFAIVMSYETRCADEAILEAHRRYVDIQTVLRGQEGFEWFPVPSLAVDHPYDAEKDVEFYRRLEAGPARVEVSPSLFVALFPEDAHMPTLMIGKRRELIKKVVVKIRKDLLEHR